MKKKKVTKNKIQMYIILVAVIIVLIPVTLLLFTKKGTYSAEAELDPLYLVSSKRVEAGDTYNFDLFFFVSETDKYKAVSADYEFSTGLVYSSASFSPGIVECNETEISAGTCTKTEMISNTGFSYESTKLFGANIMELEIALIVSSDVTPGQELTVTLKNIELTTTDDKTETIDDTSFVITVKKNIATLDDIKITGRSKKKIETDNGQYATVSDVVEIALDTPFSSDKFNYTANVGDYVSVSFGISTTDDYAKVVGSDNISLVYNNPDGSIHMFSGDASSNGQSSGSSNIGDLIDLSNHTTYRYTGVADNLKMGTAGNTITLTVTSDDGSTSLTYTINLVRDYNAESDTYHFVYGEDTMALYVAGDSDEKIINNLEPLPDNYTYQVNGNELLIKNSDGEIHRTITLLRFSTIYKIVGMDIYIPKNLKYGTFKTNFTSDNLTVRVTKNSTKVTNNNTIITANHQVELLYNDEWLDIYLVNVENIDIGGNYLVDEANKVIKNIKDGVTFGTLKSNITTDSEITIVSNDNAEMNDDSILKSGDKISIALDSGTVTYTLAILGDMTGDGLIDIDDVGKLYRYSRGKITDLEEIFVIVSDINGDGGLDIDDVGKLYRYSRHKIDSLEVTE